MLFNDFLNQAYRALPTLSNIEPNYEISTLHFWNYFDILLDFRYETACF